MNSKSFLASRTLIFNGLALVVILATHYGFGQFEADPNVPPLAAGIAALMALLAPFVNIVLRFTTTRPLSLAEGKVPWASKTLWFNGLALVVILAGRYGFADFTPDPNIPPLAAGIVAVLAVLLPVLLPIFNIALRFVTKRPVSLSSR